MARRGGSTVPVRSPRTIPRRRPRASLWRPSRGQAHAPGPSSGPVEGPDGRHPQNQSPCSSPGRKHARRPLRSRRGRVKRRGPSVSHGCRQPAAQKPPQLLGESLPLLAAAGPELSTCKPSAPPASLSTRKPSAPSRALQRMAAGEPLRASASVAEPLPASSDTPRQGFSCGSVGSGALASGLMSGNGRLPPPSESGRSVAAGLDSPQPGASGLLPRVIPKLEATRRGAHGLASAQRERWPPRKASRRRVPGLLTLAWSLLAVTVWPSAACWPRWPPRRRC